MNKNKIILIAGAIIAIGVTFFFIAGTPSGSAVEAKIGDLVEGSSKYNDKFVQVEGNLVEDSVKWNADKVELQFTVKDDDGKELHVTYNNTKPENFSDGIICILNGKRSNGSSDQFVAQQVQTRCPSKYEGEDTGEYDPVTHQVKKENK